MLFCKLLGQNWESEAQQKPSAVAALPWPDTERTLQKNVKAALLSVCFTHCISLHDAAETLVSFRLVCTSSRDRQLTAETHSLINLAND